MLLNHPNCIELEAGSILWQYMNFDKFASLIKDKSLFFCRLDMFSDPFEGSIPRIEAKSRIDTEKSIAQYHGYEFNEEKALNSIEDLSKTHLLFRKKTVANCWHINKNESDGMWQLYLKTNEGVAIQTTKQRIYKTFEEASEPVYLSKIRYLDYDNDIWFHEQEFPNVEYNILTPLFHKRIEFQQESEFRIFHTIDEAKKNGYWEEQLNHKGCLIEIDLNLLIEKIILPPNSDKSIEQKIQKILYKNNLSFELKKSKLSSDPYF